jgi:hypothetical protein
MARVRVLLVLLLTLSALPLTAQDFVRLQSDRTSDTIDSSGDSVTLTNAKVGGFGSVKVQTLDSYSGTWEVQCSPNGTDWDTASELKLTPTDSITVAYSVTDDVAIWDVGNAAGCGAIRVIATSGFAASDTEVVITATQSGGGSGGGSGGSGGTIDGTVDIEISGTAPDLNAGTGGSFTLRTILDSSQGDLLSTLATNTDRAADVLESLSDPAVHDALLSTAGDLVPTACEGATFDGAALPNVLTSEGRFARPKCTTYGIQYVMSVNADGSASAIETVFTDDAAFTPATSKGTAIGGQADDTSTDSVNEGDFGVLRISLDRLLYTRMTDPCSGGATKLYLPFDITGAATTEITPSLAGASTHYYICALNIVNGGTANNVNLVDDNSDNCASVTASLISSGLAAGDGWNFAANGGLTIGNGLGSIMRTQTSNAVLCLVTSASSELHGQFVVVAAP